MFSCQPAGAIGNVGLFIQTTFPPVREPWTIVNKNMRLVYREAHRYCFNRQDLTDIIQEGTLGLYYAVIHRNPFSSTRFATYAVWWIRKYILAFYQARNSHTDPIETMLHEPQSRDHYHLDDATVVGSLQSLDEIERLVIALRYLADEPVRLKDIGKAIGTTAACVHQIESSALKHLREFLEG